MPTLDLTLVRHVVSAYAAKRIFDLDDRDDFVQDVIIKFHRKVDSSQHPARQMSFAKQVAATMLVDWIRSRATLHRAPDIHAVPLPDESRCAPRPHTLGPDRADYCARTSTPSHSPFDEADITLDLSDIGRLIYDGYSPSDIEIQFGYSPAEISEVVDKLKAEILAHNKKLAERLSAAKKK